MAFKLEFPYKRSLGPVIGSFLAGLKEQRLLGARTTSGHVLVPPLEYDPETGESTEAELVEVGPGSQSLDRTDSVLLEIDPDWTLVRQVRPAVQGDVTLDGRLDAADLIAIALRQGTSLPEERRRDGGYDPLFDLDENRTIDASDVEQLLRLVR